LSALKICPQCGTEYELDQRFCPKDGSTLRSQTQGTDLVGETIAQYYVLKKLGEGGMGQVYLAEHVKMGRKSALKVMNPSMVHDADAISRFNREAKNASRINHTNVAAIYDFGETPDGMVFLAMEFVEGEALTKLIERLGALPPKRVADIAQQTAEGLQVAHDMGIVHRDLKPDNIMITKNRDGSDCVKVVDFGIAKAGDNEAQKVTKTGLVVGTPEYMSPEQLSGDKLDGRSDIYSLALVAFNCFTGKLPFPSETVQESMIMRLTDRPRTLSEMRPEIAWPPQLEAVMNQALERDANKRYQKSSDFGRDLAKAVEKMPSTIVAEAGTQVLGTIPPTRVAPAGGQGATMVTPPPVAPGRTVAQAAPQGSIAGTPTAVASIPASEQSYAPPLVATKSKAPLAIGGGVAALALAGVFYITVIKKADSTPTDTSKSQTQTSLGTDTLKSGTGVTGGTAKNDSTKTASGVDTKGTKQGQSTGTKGPVVIADPVIRGNGTPTVPDRTPPADHSSDIKRLDDLTNPTTTSEEKARQALQLYDRIQADLSGPELIRAKYARGSAYLILEDSDRACAIFRSIRGSHARPANLESAVEAFFTAANAPCQ
jgi:eukaryotic-like serine/threonine-protein kinase